VSAHTLLPRDRKVFNSCLKTVVFQSQSSPRSNESVQHTDDFTHTALTWERKPWSLREKSHVAMKHTHDKNNNNEMFNSSYYKSSIEGCYYPVAIPSHTFTSIWKVLWYSQSSWISAKFVHQSFFMLRFKVCRQVWHWGRKGRFPPCFKKKKKKKKKSVSSVRSLNPLLDE